MNTGLFYYENHANGIDQIFPKRNFHKDKNAQLAWGTIQASVITMKKNFTTLVQTIHDKYSEVNLSETNEAAWGDIIKFRPMVK